MAAERNEKIMIEILAEIAEKSDKKTPINLDLTSPERELNYKLLLAKKPSVFVRHRKQITPGDSFNVCGDWINDGIIYLSPEGHNLLRDLRLKEEILDIMREQNKRDRSRLRYDLLALVISTVALLSAFCHCFDSYFDDFIDFKSSLYALNESC